MKTDREKRSTHKTATHTPHPHLTYGITFVCLTSILNLTPYTLLLTKYDVMEWQYNFLFDVVGTTPLDLGCLLMTTSTLWFHCEFYSNNNLIEANKPP
jgi:hypothetical protein